MKSGKKAIAKIRDEVRPVFALVFALRIREKTKLALPVIIL